VTDAVVGDNIAPKVDIGTQWRAAPDEDENYEIVITL